MNTESNPPQSAPPGDAPQAEVGPVMHRGVWVLGLIALLALLLSALMWQKLATIQEQLARQSADSGATAVEARTLAKQAQEQVLETAARQSVMQARLNEVALQRSQLEELMQSLSRSRDENLVVDIESAVRLAQQQAQLTGSVEPLLAALKTAEQRVARAAQPRLSALQNAIARDVGRIKGTTVSDTPALLVKMDEMVRLADELPLANAVAKVSATGSLKPQREDSVVTWWQRSLAVVLDELRGLVRLSRVEHPEAVLLSPDQSFFVRENLKLRLLNARLGLLARQLDAARADLTGVAASLHTYFDASSRKTQVAADLLKQLQGQMKTLELPRVDDTLAALTTAAAGR
jgi:uroporphyrin-III C-methyltransferase